MYQMPQIVQHQTVVTVWWVMYTLEETTADCSRQIGRQCWPTEHRLPYIKHTGICVVGELAYNRGNRTQAYLLLCVCGEQSCVHYGSPHKEIVNFTHPTPTLKSLSLRSKYFYDLTSFISSS